jgi:hypothetical protein
MNAIWTESTMPIATTIEHIRQEITSNYHQLMLIVKWSALIIGKSASVDYWLIFSASLV